MSVVIDAKGSPKYKAMSSLDFLLKDYISIISYVIRQTLPLVSE